MVLPVVNLRQNISYVSFKILLFSRKNSFLLLFLQLHLFYIPKTILSTVTFKSLQTITVDCCFLNNQAVDMIDFHFKMQESFWFISATE